MMGIEMEEMSVGTAIQQIMSEVNKAGTIRELTAAEEAAVDQFAINSGIFDAADTEEFYCICTEADENGIETTVANHRSFFKKYLEAEKLQEIIKTLRKEFPDFVLVPEKVQYLRALLA